MQAPLMAAITGFDARLDDIDHRRQERLRVKRVAGEFLDVGAARERAFVADDAPWRAPWDPRARDRARSRFPVRSSCDKRVQRWIVHRQPGDALVDFVADDGHGPIISTAASARRSGNAATRRLQFDAAPSAVPPAPEHAAA